MSKLLKNGGKLIRKNGKLVRTDDPAKCECCGSPPPPQLWCCDGGTEGYFCGERVNVPGIGEMIGDAPIGICNSVKKVDDCSECGPPPPVPLGWFCDIATCMECYSKEDAAADADLFECPPDATIYDSEQECKDAGCPPEPPIVSCGVAVPSTATVALCGFIDPRFIPSCTGGNPGFAAAFNQSVKLTLQPIQPLSGQIYWEGLLNLPGDYYPHVLRLYRGTGEGDGRPCDWAQMVLTTPSYAPDDCINAFWVRNYNFGVLPLPDYSAGWSFGPSLAGVPTELRTQSSYLRYIAIDNKSICRITFGGGKENPLP